MAADLDLSRTYPAGVGHLRAAGWWRLIAVALVLLVAIPAPAAAHTSLIDSQPRAGATVSKPPRTVSLTFNEELRSRGTGIAVTGPQGTTPVTASVDGAVARIPWPPGFDDGTYAVEYRVVSADGHVVDGRVRFTIDAPGRSATSQAAAPQAADPDPPTSPPAAVPPWLWVAIILVAGGVGWAIWRTRPNDADPS